MKSVTIYSRYERFWHWAQALLVLILLVTGLEINGIFALMGFEDAVYVHTVSAVLLMLLIAFTVFWHFTTGEWKNYIPTTKNLKEQIAYYTKGMFTNGPKPHKKTSLRKLNPLQVLTYLILKIFIMPVIVITGVLYFLLSFDLIGLESCPIAPIHTIAAYVLAAFTIVHVYMTTTGSTPLSNLKAMITGKEELDE